MTKVIRAVHLIFMLGFPERIWRKPLKVRRGPRRKIDTARPLWYRNTYFEPEFVHSSVIPKVVAVTPEGCAQH
jgi:hypothetical protein